ncbi:MAG: domain S-box protein [Phycisphaerales bacterium]|nr:domain S-box protein [Phycisphaerales bacterium]
MRILLIEDHHDSADSLARLLRRGGHAVQVAALGAEALRACETADFDLIISDIGLPDLDGWELLGRIRRHCNTPAIALTAFVAPVDEARSRAAGFAAHLAKPVNFDVLKQTIARIAEPDADPPAKA